jgi:hypothetical protein
MGTVRGFRSWSLRLPLRCPADVTRYYGTSLLASGWGEKRNYYSAPVLPWLSHAFVEGMYGGRWSYKRMHSGWYGASCARSCAITPASDLLPAQVQVHRPPYPGCGCGFWAYWKAQSMTEFDAQKIWVKKFSNGSYEVTVPLSGVIEGSGAAIIGDKGFRVERARITDLAMPISGGCIFEEETGVCIEDAFRVGDPLSMSLFLINESTFLDTEQPVAAFLSRTLAVPDTLVRETIYAAITMSLGANFKWHDTPGELMRNCEPDKNYGGRH